MSHRVLLVSSALLAALTLAACGSDSGGGSDDTVPADAGLVVDAGPGLKYGSTEYTATAGEVVVALLNKDTQRHTLLIVDADNTTLPGHLEVAKSGAVDSKSYDLEAGTYKLVCDVPGHEDMRATLTVG